jgi:hypothetical protein
MRPIIPEAPILHFSLEGLLPKEHWLALNCELGTLSMIAVKSGTAYPLLRQEQQFTAGEFLMILPLLKAYPHYCPYEVLLASFNHGNVNEMTVERSRKSLYEAQEMGLWDQQMRPVRNVMSRARMKIRLFGLEISDILETGYILMMRSERKRLG